MLNDVPAEKILAAVLEMSDDAVISCDARGHITSWNDTATRLFGHSTEESLGAHLGSLFREDLRGELSAVFESAVAGDQVRHFEIEAERRDGLPMPVSLSLCAISEGDTVTAAVVLVRDATEQVLEQATLAEVQARLAEGEAAAHIGSWLWDVGTGAIQWSAEFHRIHEVDPLGFDGTIEGYLSLISAQDRDRVRAGMEEAVASSVQFETEYRVPIDSGAEKLVHVRAEPTIGATGAVIGLRGVGHETERLSQAP